MCAARVSTIGRYMQDLVCPQNIVAPVYEFANYERRFSGRRLLFEQASSHLVFTLLVQCCAHARSLTEVVAALNDRPPFATNRLPTSGVAPEKCLSVTCAAHVFISTFPTDRFDQDMSLLVAAQDAVQNSRALCNACCRRKRRPRRLAQSGGCGHGGGSASGCTVYKMPGPWTTS